MKIAHVSTFPEMKCGIAFYALDLIRHLPQVEHRKFALHYGVNPTPDSVWDADVAHPNALRTLAANISASDCDVVSLQHEFGIWGGKFGENLFDFIDCLTKPTISTLHTTFGKGAKNHLQLDILRELVDRSARVVVLSDTSKRTIVSAIQCSADKIVVVPHGVPEICYVPPPPLWASSDEIGGSCNFISLGFFRLDKGLEAILAALYRLKKQGKNFSYIIAGEPQPQFAIQENYKQEIQQLIERLGQRWSRFPGQFGGLAKMDSGLDYAANFSCSVSIA